MTSTRRVATSTRSQRRREEIVDAAASLFVAYGYHRVGVDDVATKVGITGGAIYKHFAGKQDLLFQAIDAALAPTEVAVSAAANLDEALGALAVLSTDSRRDGVLLTREVRAVESGRGAALHARIDAVRTGVSRLVAAERPGITVLDARLLGDAILALFCSTAHHSVALPREDSIDLLTLMATRVAHAELPQPTGPGEATRPKGPRPTMLLDRRDQLIDAAIDLFGRRGYWAATMDDLGAAADIAGPSVYQHFASKAELLVAVFSRGNEGLRLGLTRAFAEGSDATSVLRLLVASYVDFNIGHPEVNRLLINEALYLPELEQASIRGMQQRYVSEWVNLVQEAQPGLDQSTARFVTHAVLSVVNNRGPHHASDGNRLRDVLIPICQDLVLRSR